MYKLTYSSDIQSPKLELQIAAGELDRAASQLYGVGGVAMVATADKALGDFSWGQNGFGFQKVVERNGDYLAFPLPQPGVDSDGSVSRELLKCSVATLAVVTHTLNAAVRLDGRLEPGMRIETRFVPDIPSFQIQADLSDQICNRLNHLSEVERAGLANLISSNAIHALQFLEPGRSVDMDQFRVRVRGADISFGLREAESGVDYSDSSDSEQAILSGHNITTMLSQFFYLAGLAAISESVVDDVD